MEIKRIAMLFLMLLLVSFSLAADNEDLFAKTSQCESYILENIEEIWKNEKPPTDFFANIKQHQPWSITYSTGNAFPLNTRTVRMYNDHFQVTEKIDDEHEKTFEKKINWREEKFGVLSDDSLNLKMYIWRFNSDVGAFGYYICKYKVATELGRGRPNVGVAVSTGRPGGIPYETIDEKEQIKDNIINILIGSLAEYGF